MSEVQYPEIKGYQIEKILGKGGMGIVYLALQTSLNRNVALKVTLPSLTDSDPTFAQRFVREAHLTAAINHPNVITVYDSGEFEDSSFMAMEYISTGSLVDLERESMSKEEICQLFIGICKGLDAAHNAGLVHRDIKPDNILIGSHGQPIVTDFGIVKSQDANTELTKAGSTIGTPTYMSPEQILAKDLDGRSDLYSVGVMLFDFLEGKAPFADTTPSAIYIKHIQEIPPNLSKANSCFQTIVSRLLMKEKESRYKDANDVIEALQAVRSNTKSNDTLSQYSNSRWWFKALLLIILVGLAVVAYFMMKDPGLDTARNNAPENNTFITFKDCAECPDMVIIPSGDFEMGNENGKDFEKPVHLVSIQEFAISQSEVTFDQWDICFNALGCSRKIKDEGWGRGNLPVINVEWLDIQEYLTWLNKKSNKKYRLPSEAEWEYAARAGSKGNFSWGEKVTCSDADYFNSECNAKGPSPVKSYRANKFGVYDMHGNVGEFVEDCWHESYHGAPVDGSSWSSNCMDSSHVYRGGSWGSYPEELYLSYRDAIVFEEADSEEVRGDWEVGFRLALSLDSAVK